MLLETLSLKGDLSLTYLFMVATITL